VVHAVDKSRQAEVPMTISVRGSMLTGGFRAAANGAQGLWRISLDAIDGCVLGAAGNAADQDDKGPFKGLFAT
jgi:hypothetical protein